MPETKIVSNTSPFITLESVPGGSVLWSKMYDQVLIPPQVHDELNAGVPDYLAQFELESIVTVTPVEIDDPDLAGLDLGERYAIALAEKLGLPLLIEEHKGRRIARARGIPHYGIAGMLARCCKSGIISVEEATHNVHILYRKNKINRKTLEVVCEGITEAE